MDLIIIDNMEKEGKPLKNAAIFGYILSTFMLLFGFYTDFEKYSCKDVLIIFGFCFTLGTVALYGWLYASKYKLKITEEEIVVQTLFKKTQIYISDIKNYTCDKYRKSVFYQFKLFTSKKNFLVNTRYKNEFEELLTNHKIEHKTL